MFVKELVRLVRAYAEGSSMESFALSAAMLMSILLLQKPHRKSKAKEHSTILLCRLDLLGEGKFDELMAESHQIQKCFSRDCTRWEEVSDRKALCFGKLVMQGKLKAAPILVLYHLLISLMKVITLLGQFVMFYCRNILLANLVSLPLWFILTLSLMITVLILFF